SIRRHTSSRRDWSSDVCSSDLMDEPELRNLMFTAKLPEMKHPIAIRYPRGKGVTVEWHTPFEAIPIGKGRLIQEGNEVAILSYRSEERRVGRESGSRRSRDRSI